MNANKIVLFCLLTCIGSAAATSVSAADAPGTRSNDQQAPALVMAGQTDDPFDEGPFDDSYATATTPGLQVSDPIQGFNRPMFTFNDKLYYYFLKPTAQGVAFVLPERSRICLKNCFYNLSMPIRAVNCLFQLKGPELGIELWRFIINSTVGIGGLFDPAGSFLYLPTYTEDTGQTFGAYGSGPGFYLVIPFLGPSSGRDATGRVFDIALDPLTYLPVPGTRLLETIIKTSLDPDEYDKIKAASLDPYAAVRNGYLQYREAAIQR